MMRLDPGDRRIATAAILEVFEARGIQRCARAEAVARLGHRGRHSVHR